MATFDARPGEKPGTIETGRRRDGAYKGTVLIYRLGSLGDTVVSLPCFHQIAERFPNATRLVLTNRPVSPAAPRLMDLLAGSGLVHGTIEYDVALRSPLVLARLWRQLRRSGADTLCYLAAPRGRLNVLRDLAFFRLCGIKRVIGAPLAQELSEARSDPESGEQEFECERLARSISEIGQPDLGRPRAWDLGLSDLEREDASRVLEPFDGRPFVAVNMGGKAAENDWGEPNWRELLRTLAGDRRGLEIAVVGAASDIPRTQALAATLDKPILDLCGRLSPRGTAAVLSRASLFIGHDSGPVHLASACGVPCIGIFSNRHKPHRWHPYGRHHRIIHPSGPITTVSVAHVSEVVLGAIEATIAAGHDEAAQPSRALPA